MGTLNTGPRVGTRRRVHHDISFLGDCLRACPFVGSLILKVDNNRSSALTKGLYRVTVGRLHRRANGRSLRFVTMHLPCNIRTSRRSYRSTVTFVRPSHMLAIGVGNTMLTDRRTLQRTNVRLDSFIHNGRGTHRQVGTRCDVTNVADNIIINASRTTRTVAKFFAGCNSNNASVGPLCHLGGHRNGRLLTTLNYPRRLCGGTPATSLRSSHPSLPSRITLNIACSGVSSCLRKGGLPRRITEAVRG